MKIREILLKVHVLINCYREWLCSHLPICCRDRFLFLGTINGVASDSIPMIDFGGCGQLLSGFGSATNFGAMDFVLDTSLNYSKAFMHPYRIVVYYMDFFSFVLYFIFSFSSFLENWKKKKKSKEIIPCLTEKFSISSLSLEKVGALVHQSCRFV